MAGESTASAFPSVLVGPLAQQGVSLQWTGQNGGQQSEYPTGQCDGGGGPPGGAPAQLADRPALPGLLQSPPSSCPVLRLPFSGPDA